MGKLIPILLALIGLGAGAGAGFALRPAPPSAAPEGDCACTCGPDAEAGSVKPPEAAEVVGDFVKMNNQFVVPVVQEGAVAALVVLSLSLNVPTGGSETVYQREPKLRDIFLQVLFDHANAGGFDGSFTSGPNMERLRIALTEAARRVLEGNVFDILITDIMRQDL
ncbi:flagellar basal body-associated FliL family protein [Maritimibacter sp. HL-12]|uniref:flagellar basal body-associated FliL family protein n=1 Tax=Maritimibacter sp. HL-12 TaxID=1162418 RepID=UPI000A0EF8C2|nr:flagellar basal body-associated FliL family protein [Maritimibacter sp. HL-12]SMH42899.1 hypothetical protein SAMN05661107_1375 [Maritimibacter sp. HL-12]